MIELIPLNQEPALTAFFQLLEGLLKGGSPVAQIRGNVFQDDFPTGDCILLVTDGSVAPARAHRLLNASPDLTVWATVMPRLAALDSGRGRHFVAPGYILERGAETQGKSGDRVIHGQPHGYAGTGGTGRVIW